MAIAAQATSSLRVGTNVLANGLWHPAMLAREALAVDLVSSGRLEFGLGSGWYSGDYTQTGIPLDPPGVRISRLEESLTIASLEATQEKVEWVCQAAGERLPGLEFSVLCQSSIITRDRDQIARQIIDDGKFSAEYTVERVLESPAYLIGEVEQIVEKLNQNRERFGFSYYVVFDDALESFAPRGTAPGGSIIYSPSPFKKQPISMKRKIYGKTVTHRHHWHEQLCGRQPFHAVSR